MNDRLTHWEGGWVTFNGENPQGVISDSPRLLLMVLRRYCYMHKMQRRDSRVVVNCAKNRPDRRSMYPTVSAPSKAGCSGPRSLTPFSGAYPTRTRISAAMIISSFCLTYVEAWFCVNVVYEDRYLCRPPDVDARERSLSIRPLPSRPGILLRLHKMTVFLANEPLSGRQKERTSVLCGHV